MRRAHAVTPRAILLAALLAAAPRLAAQVVRGTVTDAGTRQTIPSALVSLVDTAGRRVAVTITDDAGHFAVRAPAPGRYALRTERIGFRGITTGAFDLSGGATVERHLAAPSVAAALPPVTVLAARSACTVRPAEGAAAALLWDEARKALEATRVAQEQRLFRLTVRRYVRTLAPDGRRVLDERSDRQSGVSENPFVSAPADTIARYGYARPGADTTTYFAPDAAVLLSDSFADAHCMRVQTPDARHAGQVGLAFEPARGRGTTDVAGVLWLDSATAALRTLEFRYTALPVRVADDRVGGRVDFLELPTGAWIVERWAIRMPVAGPDRSGREGDISVGADRARLTALREAGGEVLETFALDGRPLSKANSATLRGTAFDSIAGAPLTGATVALAGTPYSTRSDSSGRFYLTGLPDGTYTVTLAHPVITALGLPAPRAELPLHRGEIAAVSLATPSPASLRARVCAGGAAGTPRAEGLIAGGITDAESGAPLRGASVRLTWSGWRLDSRRVVTVTQGADLTSDADGAFRVCGVPAGASVTASVRAAGYRATTATITLDSTDVAVIDIAVARPDAPSAAALTVTVHGPDGEPLPGASVRLVGISDDVPTDDSGTVNLGALPPGTHMVDVRRAGFAPVRRAVQLRVGHPASLAVALDRRVPVLARVAVRGDARDATGFQARRKVGSGYYLTPEDVARRGGASFTDIVRGVPGVSITPGYGAAGVRGTITMTRAATSFRQKPLERPGGTPLPGAAAGAPKPGAGSQPYDPDAIAGDSTQSVRRRCDVQYFVDGAHVVPVNGDIDAEVSPRDVAAVELYQGAQVPPQFVVPGSACGVVVIWTKAAMTRAPSPPNGSP